MIEFKTSNPKANKKLTVSFTNAEIKEIQNYIKAAKTLGVNTPFAAAPTVEDVIYSVVVNFIESKEFTAGIEESKVVLAQKAAEKAAKKAALEANKEAAKAEKIAKLQAELDKLKVE